MRYLLIPLLLLGLPTWAADGVDTVSIIKQQGKPVTLIKIADIKAGTAVYEISLCQDSCDMWEAPADSLQALADYVYLFAVYEPQDAADTSVSADAETSAYKALPMVQQDRKNRYSSLLIDQYAQQYACKPDAREALCVMHKLFIGHHIRRYYSNFDESANTTNPVGEYPNSAGPTDIPYGGQP